MPNSKPIKRSGSSSKEKAPKKSRNPSTGVVSKEDINVEIKRHWAGIVSLYSVIGGGLSIAYVLLFVSGIGRFAFNSLIFLILLIAVIVIFTLAGKVYWENKLIISQTSICQVSCYAVFSSRVSVLGLANVEDVTVVRKGFFPHLLRYGILNIETAGEQDNFKFLYCPQPENCARLIMELREAYLSNNPDQKLR